MTWTPPSYVSIGTASSAQFNAETVDNLVYLKDRVDTADDSAACKAVMGSDEVVPINTVIAVRFSGLDEWDFGGCHASNDTEVYNPGDLGLCRGVAYGIWEPETLGYRNMWVQVNGTTTITGTAVDALAGTGNYQTIPWDARLDTGDYVEMLVYYDISGGTPSSLHFGSGSMTLHRYRDA